MKFFRSEKGEKLNKKAERAITFKQIIIIIIKLPVLEGN